MLVGTYMRSHVDESFLFTDALKQKDSRIPIAVAFKLWKKSMIFAFLVNLVHSSYNYLSTIFLMAYAIKKLSMSQTGVTSGFTIGNVIELVTVLVQSPTSVIVSAASPFCSLALFSRRYTSRS